jgi:hypothetical protein
MSQPLSPGRGHSSDRTDHIWLTTRAHRKVHGYLLNLVPLVLVLRLTVFRQVLPLVLTLFVGFAYAGLRPTGSLSEIVGAVTGRTLRRRRGGASQGPAVRRRLGDHDGGYGYAALWIAVIVGRCALAYRVPGLVATFVTRVAFTFTIARRSALSE